jgi:GT2 family glycosyltransferase|tara:strand:+ start:5123 stop:6376 length:1254 start_codon:yes stop_codon:yes gene_type:complete
MKNISFLINTSVNTLDHVKVLIKSLKLNLSDETKHEILVFIDSDNENTKEYLIEQKKNFNDLKIITHKINPCVGYSRNNNILVEYAKYDICSYLQSDMVISPNYDLDVLKDLKENQILSSTRIEPPLHGDSPEKITKEFSSDPNEFQFDEFNSFANSNKRDDIIKYFFAPITFYKKTWLSVGGYDTLFRRSREDTDFVQRCLHSGILLEQTFKANVYHFTCLTSRGKNWFDQNNTEAQMRVELQKSADQIELNKFVRKWGGFSHTEPLNRYNVDLELNFNNLNILRQVEPFFDKIYTKLNYQDIIKDYQNHHSFANSLLNFTEEQWETNKKYYNHYCIDDKFHNVKFTDYDVLVSSADGVDNQFLEICYNIHALIDEYNIGKYKYGNTNIDIRNKVLNTPPINVVNPKFEDNLLEII